MSKPTQTLNALQCLADGLRSIAKNPSHEAETMKWEASSRMALRDLWSDVEDFGDEVMQSQSQRDQELLNQLVCAWENAEKWCDEVSAMICGWRYGTR